ncbi:MAG: UTRA domain-containing protein [Alphaproteobacteria bacterium]|nr:UTRA domain-containing protein [Alphaproteobacteria bacterium]
MLELVDITEEIRRRKGEHSCEEKLLKSEPAVKALAFLFGVAEGAPLYHSIMLHRENGLPIQYEERWDSPDLVPDYLSQDFMKITPGDYLRTIFKNPHIEHIVEARMPLPTVRKFLDMRDGEPCLLLHRRALLGKRTIARSWFWYPGSRHRLGTEFDAHE